MRKLLFFLDFSIFFLFSNWRVLDVMKESVMKESMETLRIIIIIQGIVVSIL